MKQFQTVVLGPHPYGWNKDHYTLPNQFVNKSSEMNKNYLVFDTIGQNYLIYNFIQRPRLIRVIDLDTYFK